jgi:DNA-binding NarL/FixJ family response regulator
MRDGLKLNINATSDMMVAGEAGDGQEALNKIRENDYDAVILDISLPGRDGLDTLVEIKRLKPSLPVLILSSHPAEQYALRTYRAGATGYLSKMCPPAEIIVALQKAVLGKKYINPEFSEYLLDGVTNKGHEQPHHNLSNREYQVLCLIASGKTVSMIASQLSLSVKTVSTYRSFILRKMNMKNNAELTRYAIENKLV